MTDVSKSSALSRDASALIRAARGGDDATPEELAQVLSTFRSRRQRLPAEGLGLAGWLGFASGKTRSFDRGPRRSAWRAAVAAAALVLTGSLAALADWNGVFARLSTWLPDAAPAERDRAGEVFAPRAPVHTPPSTEGRAEPAPAPPLEPMLPLQPPPAASPKATVPPPLRAPSAPPAATHASTSNSERELDLIVAARNALRERRYADARRESARHALGFPRGEYSQEREAIQALADCRDVHDATRGAAFLRRWPESLFLERITRDCNLSSNSVPPGLGEVTHD